MTSEKSGQTKGKRPVGPWTRIDSERERWVRPIGGDDSGDYAAEVRVNEREKPGTWWTLYRAEDTTDECAYALVESVEAGKRAVDSHLEAAGWTIGTVTTAAPDGHFTTNETIEWDELSKPEAGLRAATNRDRWIKMGLNGGRYIEPGFEHSADRENYLLNEHDRLTEVIEGARQALDEAGAPTHTPHGRLLGLGGRVGAMFERSLAEPVKPATRPKVAWIPRGEGAYVVDDRGQEVGGVWPEGKSGEWAWYARRALLPSASALDAATKDEAQAACLEVLRTWADIEGEQVRALSVGEVFAAASGPGESGSLVGEGSTGPLRKAWNEWCRLSAEPIRTDAQEAECRFWRCLLDEAGIETWDAVPREEIPPCPGDIDGQRVTDLRDPTPPAPVAARPRVSGWVKGSDNFWSVYGATGAEVASVWKATEGWCLNVRRAFLPPVEDSHLSSEAAAKEAALAVLRTWADVEGEQERRVDQDTAGDDYEAPEGEAAARHSGSLDAFSTVLGIVDRTKVPPGMSAEWLAGAACVQSTIIEAIQRVSGGLPMSADEAAENPPVRCGTFRAHLVPEQQETVAEVKRAARVEALEETIAAWKRRVDDLKGEIRKARDILSGVDCEGDRLEDQASTAAVAIRSLREVNGAAWLTLKTVQVGGETLKERAFAVVQEVASLREQNERVQASTAPKAIEPAGPLSLLVATDGGFRVVLATGGPWDGWNPDEVEAPPSAGLWRWTGTATATPEREADNIFIGEWTALPLPVLP